MKDNNENTHVTKTLLVMDQDIYRLEQTLGWLRSAKETLVTVYGDGRYFPAVETVAPTAVQTDGRAKKAMCVDVRRAKRGASGDGGALRAGTARGPKARGPEAATVTATTGATTAVTVSELDTTTFDKPNSLGGAMKLLARTLPQPFSLADLRAALEADADFAKVLAETHPSTIHGNLAYWTKVGKIQKTGEGDAALYRNVKF